ncbi:murein hydrolase activator EnvC family protein [Streptomyces shenzhenensis]|uniref:murein hydrolase activator EnvC family protein n=1 Tax=Streptomyces shenzhenensis TaxID=943815 RepID=UPI0037F5519A
MSATTARRAMRSARSPRTVRAGWAWVWAVVLATVVPSAVLGGSALPARAQPPGPAAATLPPPAPPPAPPPSAPVPALARVWPVGTRPVVIRGWEPPATAYGPGHRGVDLGAPPGAPVRAVAAGRVSFAGRVAGRGVVSVELAGTDLRTTYEPVDPSVRTGDEVAAGEVVGRVAAAGSHCAAGPCVHWGLLRGDTYLDPLLLLPPWLLRRGPSRLLPVLGVPPA